MSGRENSGYPKTYLVIGNTDNRNGIRINPHVILCETHALVLEVSCMRMTVPRYTVRSRGSGSEQMWGPVTRWGSRLGSSGGGKRRPDAQRNGGARSHGGRKEECLDGHRERRGTHRDRGGRRGAVPTIRYYKRMNDNCTCHFLNRVIFADRLSYRLRAWLSCPSGPCHRRLSCKVEHASGPPRGRHQGIYGPRLSHLALARPNTSVGMHTPSILMTQNRQVASRVRVL
jgi:hypothetical protein